MGSLRKPAVGAWRRTECPDHTSQGRRGLYRCPQTLQMEGGPASPPSLCATQLCPTGGLCILLPWLKFFLLTQFLQGHGWFRGENPLLSSSEGSSPIPGGVSRACSPT